MKKIIIICFLLIATFSFAQLGSNCGVPPWLSTKGYSINSYVLYNDNIYKTPSYSSDEVPGVSGNWVNLGSCSEQIFIDNPILISTDCVLAQAWNSSLPNYNTNDIVSYNYGVYRANYWVAGSAVPNVDDAYTFLGICVYPPTITPANPDNDIVIMPSFVAYDLITTIDSHGFSSMYNKVRIKKTTESTFAEYNLTLISGDSFSYQWSPTSYGDYDIQFVSKNSVGVETIVNRIIKISVSTPPTVSLTSPANNSIHNQLVFSPIAINFNVIPAQNPIQSISVKDNQTNVSSPVTVSGSSTSYTFAWTPSLYGLQNITIVAVDTQGTTKSITLTYEIKNPATQNIFFDTLPFQLKAIKGIPKEFVFDKTIIGIKIRNKSLTQLSFNNNILQVESTTAGRTGLEITTSDNLKYYVGLRIDNADGSVPKLPDYVAVGSVSEDIDDDVNFYKNGIDNVNDLKNNRMDVRYTYVNGGPLIGWNTWQPDRVLKFARNSVQLGLTPYFIFYNIPDGGESYTTNKEHIQSADYMNAYFVNLNLFIDQAKEILGDEYFGIILEPDFLGYNQQNNEPTTMTTAVSETTVADGAGTLLTLVNRINKTINDRRVQDGLNLEFGWQLNLWAKPNVAGIRGIIRETDTGIFQTKLTAIEQTANDILQYGMNVGIMSNSADFVSIDKYGLDALGYSNASDPADPSSYTWFWNNDHWNNYLKFVKKLHTVSGKRVILWQIPVGHINNSLTINEYTQTNFVPLTNTTKRYEDSASNFFFGETMDFSTDLARYNYFSQNVHNDPKLVADSVTKHVTWGNHFNEVLEAGTSLVLMGAGVGDSTDGIGNPDGAGATLTDDHYWIQKLQSYYLNHLVYTVPSFADITVIFKDASNAFIPGVAVTLTKLSDNSTLTATSDVNGNALFPNLQTSVGYSISYTKSGFAFLPQTVNVTLLTANSTYNVVGSNQIVSISGAVKTPLPSATLIPNVVVKLLNSDSSEVIATQTSVDGNFSFTDLISGLNYKVIAEKLYYNFAEVSLNNVIANQTGVLVEGSMATYTISGTVKDGVTPIVGAIVTASFNATSLTTYTNSLGEYSFTNLSPAIDYTITPSYIPLLFVPSNIAFTNLSANQVQNFVKDFYLLSGEVKNGSIPVAGANIQITLPWTDSSHTGGQFVATTDVAGKYHFDNALLQGYLNYTSILMTTWQNDNTTYYPTYPGSAMPTTPQTFNFNTQPQAVNLSFVNPLDSSSVTIVAAGTINLDTTSDMLVTDGTTITSVVYTINGVNYTATNTSGSNYNYSWFPEPILFDTDIVVSALATASNGMTATTAITFHLNCTGVGCPAATWNGTTWSNTTGPTASWDAIIDGDFNTSTNGVFTARTLPVNAGKNFTINSGNNITVANAIANSGIFTVENNANLVQTNSATNTGNIIVKRNSATLQLYDYSLWSSPVAAQGLQAFSPNTLDARFYTYNPVTDLYSVVNFATNPNFEVGKSYLICVPNNWVAATPTTFNGVFTGVPNNGTITLSGLTATSYYAIGNPYPSTINVNSLYDENPTMGTLYFWRKTNGVAGTSYATKTRIGATASGGLTPSDDIAVGQGFIAIPGATTINFTNAMRVTPSNTSQFLRTTAEEKNRVWLNLSSSSETLCQIMIGYVSGATSGEDHAIDGRYFNDSPIALTSLINSDEYAIQGRALPFSNTDSVPLGFKSDVIGNYTIAIDHVDGIFSTGQAVYLKDNLLSTIVDLSAGSYSFSSQIGTFNSRFEIVYQSTLGNDDFTASEIILYSHKGTIKINSGTMIMQRVRVFDLRGVLIAEKNEINKTEETIITRPTTQVLLVEITDNNGSKIIKKIVQ